MQKKSERTVLQIAQAGLVRSEHVEQSYLIQRLALIEGRHPELSLLYAVPNGGLRSKAQAGKLKAEGVKPSVPDLVLPVPRYPFHGLYVEMKKIGEYADRQQRDFQSRLLAQGYAVVECQGDDAAFGIVVGYLKRPAWIPDSDERIRAMRLLAGLGQGRAIVRWTV